MAPKTLDSYTLPLTGAGAVDLIINDLCVFACDTRAGRLTLVERAPGVTLDEAKAVTGTSFEPGNNAQEKAA